MKKVVKYIRVLRVVYRGTVNEYQNCLTSKERFEDIDRCKSRGFSYDPKTQTWTAVYPSSEQTHYITYYKIKYI